MKYTLQQKYSISIIGSGNVAWHIAYALLEVGHVIDQIYARNEVTGRDLALKLKTNFQPSTDFSKSKSQIFIFAVPDDAIAEILTVIQVPPGAIIFTLSGSISLQYLTSLWKRAAVFYPLQTFSKRRTIDFSTIPIIIEAYEQEILGTVKDLALSLTEKVYEFDSSKREKIHLAAVFASNFTNYLLTISKDILVTEKIDFKILEPLVEESIQKAFSIGPQEGQTGPAVRGDFEIWQRHLHLLGPDENVKKIYDHLSNQIYNSNNNLNF